MRERPFATRPVQSLIDASRRFERWRAARPRGERIPPELWCTALDMARVHGVSRTSQTLHLDYYALQRRLAEPATGSELAAAASPAGFVELALPAARGGLGCQIAIQAARGAAVRAELQGLTAQELLWILRGLQGNEP